MNIDLMITHYRPFQSQLLSISSNQAIKDNYCQLKIIIDPSLKHFYRWHVCNYILFFKHVYCTYCNWLGAMCWSARSRASSCSI